MIKCELKINDSDIHLGKYTMRSDYSQNWVVLIAEKVVNFFDTLEQAIQYCLENSDEQ